MKRYVLFLALLTGLAFMWHAGAKSTHAFSEGGCDGDCGKCHTLSTQDVTAMLKKMNLAHAKVLEVKPSPVRSLWEVSIDDNGKRGLFYIDFSKKYVIPGPIIEAGTGANKTAESLEKIQPKKKADASRIPLAGALAVGSRNAPKKVIVFTDPD